MTTAAEPHQALHVGAGAAPALREVRGLLLAGEDPPVVARGDWLIPRLVDLASHLREPGLTHKGSIDRELRRARIHGFGLVAAMPDTAPVLDNAQTARFVAERAARVGDVGCCLWGALTRELAGQSLADMAALKAVGAFGVSDGGRPLADAEVLRRALQYAGDLGLVVHLTPVDAKLRGAGCAHEGRVATRLGLPAIPAVAEAAQLAHLLELVRDTGTAVHFGRLSAARSVDLIAQAKDDGLPVTADTSIFHLHYTDVETASFDPRFRLDPPLRSDADRSALAAGVEAGVIDVIVADHQPHESDNAERPWPEIEPGQAAYAPALGLLVDLVQRGVLSLQRAVDAFAYAPARLCGIAAEDLGALLVDPDGDAHGNDSVLDGPWCSSRRAGRIKARYASLS